MFLYFSRRVGVVQHPWIICRSGHADSPSLSSVADRRNVKPETQFWQRIRPRLVKALPAPAHVQRMEPGASSPGCPDVNICTGGTEIWIENKVVAGGNRVRTLTPAQVAWMSRRATCGGRVWIMCLHAPTDDRLLWPGAQAGKVMDQGLSASPSLRLASPWDLGQVATLLLA